MGRRPNGAGVVSVWRIGALFQILYFLVGFVNKQGARSKSCWISHIHCFFTVPSACLYWLTQPVDIWSSEWMIEGPGGGV